MISPEQLSVRLSPPFWRHDAYSLRRLADALEAAIPEVVPSHVVQPCVVDLGAGDSPYQSLFAMYGARYVACDIDAPQGGDFVPITIGEPLPLPDSSAHVVASFQVLEHVWDLDWYLGEAKRLLTTEGKLLLSTHGTWLYHPHPTDFRRWTRTGLIAELESRGFAVESVRAVVGPLAWTTQFRALGLSHALRAIPLIGSILAALVNTVYFSRMCIEDVITPKKMIEDNAAIYLVVARAQTHA